MDRRLSTLSLFLLVTALCLGCDKPPDPATPADHFNETQAGTSTPHGKYVQGSAEDTEGGRVRYKTEGGETFTANVIPEEDGGYRYTNPQKVE